MLEAELPQKILNRNAPVAVIKVSKRFFDRLQVLISVLIGRMLITPLVKNLFRRD
jgi:hypothetical protein